MDRKVFVDKILANMNKYQPIYNMNCADFVSWSYINAGISMPRTSWVPDFFDSQKHPHAKLIPSPKPGDLIVFHSTYNAVPSDKTHVGIVINPNPETKSFIHFSASTMTPVLTSYRMAYWQSHFECFLSILPDDVEQKPPILLKIKLFFHNGKMCVIFNKIKYNVSSIKVEDSVIEAKISTEG